MKLLLLALLILGVGVAGIVLVTRSPTRNYPTSGAAGPDEPQASRYSAVIVPGASPSPSLAPPMETPEQRWQRLLAFNREFYADVGAALGLDAATEQQVLALLTGLHARPPGNTTNEAEALEVWEAKRDEQLTALLGPDAPQRFKAYFDSLAARKTVHRLNERLREDDRIQGASKERLVALVHTGTRPESQDWTPPSFQTLPPEVTGSQRSDVLITMASSEDYFRLQLRSHQRMEREAAKFLTPTQLEAFAKSHAEEDQSWREGMASSRKEVGLDPVVPDEPEATFGTVLRRRVALAGDVTFGLTLTVNGQPTTFSHTGSNRKVVGFQAAHDVWVEAIPILYDDKWLEMLITYYEPSRGGRRPLEQTVLVGTQTMLEGGAPAAPHDAGSEILTGRRTYEVHPSGITARQVM
jgi:hypothetical protein